jgi:acyl-CoA reductase-like NAD-dependent aldehyde dehydrogenase
MSGEIDLRGFVAGARTDFGASARLAVHSPWSGEPIGELPVADEDAVAGAVGAAAAASAWWRSTPRERSEALHCLADLLSARAEEFAALESLDGGKLLVDARAEVAEGVDVLRFFAGAARTMTVPAGANYAPGAMSTVLREPIGVVGLISPWNYPLLEALWKISPALAAGNSVVIKPSELAPASTLLFAEMAAEVLAPGVLNALTGPGLPTGRALVADPRVGMVSMTGSSRTGRAVAALAGETLTRVHLELGGNAPAIVLEDVDPAATVAALLPGAFSNAGQSCTAAARILVVRTRHEELVGELGRQAAAIGTAADAAAEGGMQPLISARQRDRVAGFLARAREQGATVLGGEPGPGPGWSLTPAVVTGVDQDSEIVQEEVFGPVVTVQPVEDLEHALALADDVDQGLAASIWTASLDAAASATARLGAGTVWVNEHSSNPVEMPFSGFRDSGHGIESSRESILEYSRTKHVMTRGTPT